MKRKTGVTIIVCITFVVTFFIIGILYKENSIKHKIINYINLNTDDKTPQCYLNINEITKFKWDKMYIFYEASEENINEILNVTFFKNPGDLLPHTGIVFMYKNKIVYSDVILIGVDDIKSTNNVIYFLEDPLYYKEYTPDNAVLKVTKRFSRWNGYYVVLN